MTKYKIMKYEREDGFQFFSIVESDDNSSNSIELTEQEFLFLGNLFSFLFFEEGLVELKDN